MMNLNYHISEINILERQMSYDIIWNLKKHTLNELNYKKANIYRLEIVIYDYKGNMGR